VVSCEKLGYSSALAAKKRDVSNKTNPYKKREQE
jgi:hypothetical protein